MKKIISILLALFMMFSISAPAFAADSESSIIVDSKDVIVLANPTEPFEMTSRKTAPQVTALDLYDYGWIEGTDHWGVIIKVTGYGNDVRRAYWNDTQLSSSDKSLYDYWVGADNAVYAFAFLYDCGPITEPGTYTFKTTYKSTNWPYTEKSISAKFNFEDGGDNT